MAWWEPDQMEMARLSFIITSTWNKETRNKAVDALASYRRNALPILTNIASTTWNTELKEYIWEKIKQINEGTI
jgi:hypothetical protein